MHGSSKSVWLPSNNQQVSVYIINPRCVYAATGYSSLSVCLSVCLFVYSGSACLPDRSPACIHNGMNLNSLKIIITFITLRHINDFSFGDLAISFYPCAPDSV